MQLDEFLEREHTQLEEQDTISLKAPTGCLPAYPPKGNHYPSFRHRGLIWPTEGRTTALMGMAVAGHWGGKKWNLGLVQRGNSLSQCKEGWRSLEQGVRGLGPAGTEGQKEKARKGRM